MDMNSVSLDTICAALCYAIGIEPPAQAAAANPILCDYVDRTLNGKKVDRILMYNPDAIGQWVAEKYAALLTTVTGQTEVEVPLCSVMPSVTPVCFGTMYTGAQPAVHGITKYEKPVIKIDTIFDALLRAGKKVCIVANPQCSLGNIFLEREMDYYRLATLPEINAKAAELVLKDEYDFIVVYNGNYDHHMHKVGPEGLEALCQLKANDQAFALLNQLVKDHWKGHNTLVGFAMDHGCHEIDGGSGSHGLDMPEDLNIVHRYKIHPAAE